ncbi:predicted protein [Botrytis cinerea T4]|uniref:Uncharacterized protein n=1 Tax=Botryotinia fuckeliana (strain T4) TaxID=999810 RepID=G2Y1U7_BOTF4|nr:predicted protein [Botrytis cinerea T4]
MIGPFYRTGRATETIYQVPQDHAMLPGALSLEGKT